MWLRLINGEPMHAISSAEQMAITRVIFSMVIAFS
jgi:hypothetical protein